MKHFFLILLLLSFLEIFPDENPLDLGEYEIVGSIENLQDTIKIYKEFKEFWKTDPTRFEYDPQLAKVKVKHFRTIGDENRLALWLQGGNNYCANLNAVYSSSTNKILNFRTDLQNYRYEPDWNATNFNLGWFPYFQIKNAESDFVFNSVLNYSNQQSDLGDTENFGLDFYADLNSFVSLNQLSAFTIKTGLQNFRQNDETQTDLDLSTKLQIESHNLIGRIGLNYLKHSLSGSCAVLKEDYLFLRNIGFWFAFDKLHLYPSLKFEAEFNPISALYFKINNDPEISDRSRKELFRQNSYQQIEMDKLQTKKPLNGFFIIEFNKYIPLTLFYNVSYEDDLKSYSLVSDEFYEQENVDLFSQKMGLKAYLEYKSLKVKRTFIYHIREKFVPYLPEWESFASLELSGKKWFVEISCDEFKNRKDENKEKMEHVFLLNFNGSIEIRKNMRITADIENLLDENYRKYSGLPLKSLRVSLGLKVVL